MQVEFLALGFPASNEDKEAVTRWIQDLNPWNPNEIKLPPAPEDSTTGPCHKCNIICAIGPNVREQMAANPQIKLICIQCVVTEQMQERPPQLVTKFLSDQRDHED